MRVALSHGRSPILTAFAGILIVAGTLLAQESNYRVKPVYTPPLERPEVKAERQNLPDGATGSLPSFDGEHFQVNLKPQGQERPSEEQARGLLDQVLKALSWARDPAELELARTMRLRSADPAWIDQHASARSQENKKALSGRLGRLSRKTEQAVDESANEAKEQARRQQEVLVFEQRVQGVPIDNAGVRAVWQTGKGFVAIAGRVFNAVEVGNQRKLNAAQAIQRARAYVARSTKVLPEPAPQPELVILPYGKTMRFAWRLDVTAEEGTYRLWLDAASGEVLQLEPQFFSDSAAGLVFNPDPTAGTTEKSFEVNAPSSSQYQLVLAGRINENNAGADGVTGDLAIADAGSGSANFNAAPANGTAVERTSDAGYNGRFQEVNGYAWVYSDLKLMEALGSETFPSLTVTVNHNNPCGFGLNNACGGGSSVTFGIGQATTSSSTSASALFNSAIDATVVTHEFGHVLSGMQVGVGGGSLTGALSEGLSDFWAATVHNTPIFAGWWKHNGGNTPVQTGFAPREAEQLDVFPEHRAFSTDSHADGQIVDWALWSTRSGLNSLGPLGTLSINVSLLKALTTTGIGITTGSSDKRVHDSLLDLMQQLTTQYSGSRSIHKLLAGFARAGIMLSERDAVIDINDDFLARGSATGPVFTIWTGRDYQFSGETAQSASVFNPQFEVEVANDEAFTVNRVTSGVLGGVTVNAAGVPQATWTLPTADWNTLKSGDYLYYRVTTRDAAGGNTRLSTSPGNGFLVGVPVPRAVVNESGECECTCATAVPPPGESSSLPWVMMVPPLVALIWRRRLSKV